MMRYGLICISCVLLPLSLAAEDDTPPPPPEEGKTLSKEAKEAELQAKRAAAAAALDRMAGFLRDDGQPKKTEPPLAPKHALILSDIDVELLSARTALKLNKTDMASQAWLAAGKLFKDLPEELITAAPSKLRDLRKRHLLLGRALLEGVELDKLEGEDGEGKQPAEAKDGAEAKADTDPAEALAPQADKPAVGQKDTPAGTPDTKEAAPAAVEDD